MADLNIPRSEASSICHKDYIYIFCGMTTNNAYLNSFERISLTSLQSGGGSWELMPIPPENLLPKRISPAIVSYNDNEIVLIKGNGGGKDASRISLYDTTKTTDCWRTIFDHDPVLFSNFHRFKTWPN